ncbi:MAG: hypothetical protein HY544_01215 [Candidatus Diapherotrites archaeon]|uniref:Blue (type 1) copper domain-containing protein n=1 Tax=Candidatus Iainarchaeum sp. TaxID=3101447 RepID=A0A8T3YMI5_9ARCH|nr:hypothetical protein [Candidatus Diapherotrites archaeon]
MDKKFALSALAIFSVLAILVLSGCAQEKQPDAQTQQQGSNAGGNDAKATQGGNDSVAKGEGTTGSAGKETGATAKDGTVMPGAGKETDGSAAKGDGAAAVTGNETTTTPPAGNEGTTAQPKEYTVKITDTGYVPDKLTIKKGDKVTWVNESSGDNWPATAKHPTHEVYPGSSIAKCSGAEKSTIFDACSGIRPGQSYSFTFNEKGAWAYHEHIAVKMFGQITVE